MATSISLTTSASDSIALGGAAKVSIQELEGTARTIIVEGSNDNSEFTKIAKKELGPGQLDVIHCDGCAFMRFSVEESTASIAVNPFDRAASSEVVQEVALNATPPTIDTASGGVILITGATSSTTVKLPEFPADGERVTIINQATAAWTLSGNGNNIDGSASVNFPGRIAPRSMIFDGDNWNTIEGAFSLEGTWVPTLTNGAENLVPTYSIQNGFYTVHGNTATIWGQVAYSSKTSSGGSNVRLGGLPAWLAPASGQKVTGMCGDTNDMMNARCTLDYNITSTNIFTFMKAANTPVPSSDLAGACGDGCFFNITYRIA